MKTKRFLSMVIAAAMAMQCAAFSVLADNTASVTVVANDIDTDWAMNWNYERYEDGFSYMSDCSYDNGLKIIHNGDKYTEIKKYAFLSDVTTASTGEKVVTYNAAGTTNSFATDSAGNIVAYNADDTTQTLHPWQHKDRSTYEAKFNVGEKSNNGQPIAVEFDYKALNPGNEVWMAAVIDILGFYIYPNFQGTKVSAATGVGLNNNPDSTNYRQDVVAKIPVGENTDPNGWHSVKFIISPELAANGQCEMTAIEVDGVVTQLEGIYGKALSGNDKIYIDTIAARLKTDKTNRSLELKNLKITRGIAPVTAEASVADGAKDVIPQNMTVKFSDSVTLSDGAVKLYENGTQLPASAFAVTMSDDSKTATVSLNEYKSLTSYKLVVDKAYVTGAFGAVLADSLEINFTSAKNVTIVADDITTDWAMNWNYERYKDGYSYMSDCSYDDGLKIVNDGSKFTEINNVKFLSAVTTTNGVQTVTYDAAGTTHSFATDAAGNIVAYNAEDATQTLHPWKHKDRSNYEAKFNVGEKSNNGQPITVEFDYKVQNAGNEVYMAAVVELLGFYIYPNFQGTKVSTATGVGLNNNPDSTNYRQDVAAKIPVGENTDPNGWHSVKLIISPELAANGQCEMTAIEVDGVVTQLEGIYGKSLSGNDKIYIDTIAARLRADKTNRSLELKNLKVYRSDENVNISSSVTNGATEVVPENIEVRFTSPVSLSDGAVKVYEKGVEMSASDYTVTLNADATVAYVSIPEYKSRTSYKLVVDKNLVSGLMGGEVQNGLEISFISAKKVDDLDGSGDNLAAGYTVAAGGYGGVGQKFTTVETDADGVTTVTVDNDTWNKAKAANTDKSGNQEWVYDADGDGTAEKVGYASWDFSTFNIKNFTDVKNSTEPIVISMDYAFENAGNNHNDLWTKMGDSGQVMYMFSAFGQKPNVSGSGWNGAVYANGVTESDWHTVQYVINPVLDENNKTVISQITLDGEVIKDTKGEWISYSAAKDTDAANGQYIKELEMRLKLVTDATDANGAYLPTVLKFKNFSILRAKPLTAVIDTDAVTNADNTLSVRFSDPVTEAELSNLKVLKGADVVENAISAVSVSEDGLNAKVTVNLDATAGYNLVTADITDIYGVKSSTESIAFEYYNTTDGYVTIAEAKADDNGTNTTVSFTFTGTKTVSPVVIAAAYDENMSLIGVNMKPVDLTPLVYVSDSIILENVTGAAAVQLMAWDSVENMAPYCLAKDVK